MLSVAVAGMQFSFVCTDNSESPGSATTHIFFPPHPPSHPPTTVPTLNLIDKECSAHQLLMCLFFSSSFWLLLAIISLFSSHLIPRCSRLPALTLLQCGRGLVGASWRHASLTRSVVATLPFFIFRSPLLSSFDQLSARMAEVHYLMDFQSPKLQIELYHSLALVRCRLERSRPLIQGNG